MPKGICSRWLASRATSCPTRVILKAVRLMVSATTSKPTDASTTKSIGRDEALSIALKNAGIKSSQAKKVKVEKDRENGRTIYEVEFTADGYEYEYEIDASSGKILKKEKERDDD